MEQIVHRHQMSLFDAVAQRFFSDIMQESSGSVVVALPGGRSIVGALEMIRKRAHEFPKEQWERLHFFMVDERRVPLTDKESNFRLLSEVFFEPLLGKGLLTPRQLHPFDATLPEAADRYLDELSELGGRFHITFLGVGEDAHVAGLFPGHHSFEAVGKKFLTFDDSPKPPPERMSASRELILSSRSAFALFIGEGKRQALKNFHDPNVSERACPAKIIQQVEKPYAITDIVDR